MLQVTFILQLNSTLHTISNRGPQERSSGFLPLGATWGGFGQKWGHEDRCAEDIEQEYNLKKSSEARSLKYLSRGETTFSQLRIETG